MDGILVQLPLPKGLHAEEILERIDPKGRRRFPPFNIGRLAQRIPAAALHTFGVVDLLESTGIDFHGQNAVIVGASNIVGRPMGLELY